LHFHKNQTIEQEDISKALNYYSKALKVDPNHDLAKEALHSLKYEKYIGLGVKVAKVSVVSAIVLYIGYKVWSKYK